MATPKHPLGAVLDNPDLRENIEFAVMTAGVLLFIVGGAERILKTVTWPLRQAIG